MSDATAQTAYRTLPFGEDGVFAIEVSVQAPAFFVWLEVADDPTGRFDDNLVALLPGRNVFLYRPSRQTTADALMERLSISHI